MVRVLHHSGACCEVCNKEMTNKNAHGFISLQLWEEDRRHVFCFNSVCDVVFLVGYKNRLRREGRKLDLQQGERSYATGNVM